MVDLFSLIIYPIIFILPAYVANASPVIFGGGTPIDLDKKFGGKPIFGKHKTIRGLIAGIMCGILVGLAESTVPAFGFMFVVGILESFGTHFGDLLGSFIKRQWGMKEGSRANMIDQYLFLVFALFFALPVSTASFPSVYGILFLFVFTWIMHRLTNIAAHMLKLKEVPW